MLPIKFFPDPVLRKPSNIVDVIDDSIRTLFYDMAETMYQAPGVGLAAPQIGKNIRLVTIDISEQEEANGLLKMVNPVLTYKDPEKVLSHEGCLSLPGYFSDIARHKSVTVEFLNEFGEEQQIKTEGLLAMCLQHEIDHLDGILFIDHLSMIKRGIITRKIKKSMRGSAG